MKLLEATSGVTGEMRHHKQKVAYEPSRQLSNELRGGTSGIFVKLESFTHSHVQVDNPTSVTGRHPNTIRTMIPQNVFSHTNPTIQLGVNNEPPHSTKGSEGTMYPPFGLGVNRG